MSIKISTLVWEKDLGSSARKLVMLYLADKVNDEGQGFWGSKKKTAKQTQVSRPTVIKCLKEFASEGLVEECGIHPQWNTQIYNISVAALRELPDVEGGVKNLAGVSSDAAEGVKPVNRGCKTALHKPSIHENKTARARAGAPWVGALRSALEPFATTELEGRRMLELVDEALAFDGRRVLVKSAFARDRYGNDLSKALKGAGLVVTNQKSDMRLEDA